VKIGIAYRRTLLFEKTPRARAEQVFTRLFSHLGEGPSWEEAAPAGLSVPRDRRAASEKGLPVQIHTGLQEGTGNVLANSDPLLLTNLFLEYPRAKFDVFHAGYPFADSLLSLAKNFPNVFLDFSWVHIISRPPRPGFCIRPSKWFR
jgi:hypothetical protein